MVACRGNAPLFFGWKPKVFTSIRTGRKMVGVVRVKLTYKNIWNSRLIVRTSLLWNWMRRNELHIRITAYETGWIARSPRKNEFGRVNDYLHVSVKFQLFSHMVPSHLTSSTYHVCFVHTMRTSKRPSWSHSISQPSTLFTFSPYQPA